MERKRQRIFLSQRGYTLVEVIAVLVIFSVLASVVIPRYVDFETGAKQRAIEVAIAELNGREGLTWVNHKISVSGYVDDNKIHGEMVYVIDPEYTWNPGEPTVSGGTLNFKGVSANLNRIPSNPTKPAEWRR
jgi:prepilin-type N-terminal cleavage/methylation domain-containing protein